MPDGTSAPCAVLRVGLWNGSSTCERGRTLYQVLLTEALKAGLRGGTTSGSVEGSRSTRAFRTVESEVSSNELPVFLEFVDELEKLEQWIPACKERIKDDGVIVLEGGHVWGGRGFGEIKGEGGPTVKEPQHYLRAQHAPLDEKAYNGLQVQIFTLERNTIQGKPVYQAAAEFLRKKGILWISTTRGVAGFGDQRRIHQAHWLFRRNDVPIVTTVLDRAEKLERWLPSLVEFVGDTAFVVSKSVVWHHP